MKFKNEIAMLDESLAKLSNLRCSLSNYQGLHNYTSDELLDELKKRTRSEECSDLPHWVKLWLDKYPPNRKAYKIEPHSSRMAVDYPDGTIAVSPHKKIVKCTGCQRWHNQTTKEAFKVLPEEYQYVIQIR